MHETIKIEDRWYVLATSSRADDRIRVLKHGDTFAVFDRFGDIQPIGTGEQGIYHQGTRFLSQLELYLNGRRPMLLNSSVKQDNSSLAIDLTTPDFYSDDGALEVLKGTIHVFRAKLLWNACCHEHLRLANFGHVPIPLSLVLRFGADYVDIFEVRGFRRARRGYDLAPALLEDRVILSYRGLDGVSRHTALGCAPAPNVIAPDQVEYALVLPPKGKTDLHITIMCEPGGGDP